MVLLGIACQNGRLLHMGDHNPYVETRRVVNMAHRHSDMEAEWTQQTLTKNFKQPGIDVPLSLFGKKVVDLYIKKILLNWYQTILHVTTLPIGSAIVRRQTWKPYNYY